MTNHDELKKELAVANATAMFQNLALIGALAERHLVDPAKVADWAEFFAKGMENSVGNGLANREHLGKVAARLRDYARQLVNIVKKRLDSGEAEGSPGCGAARPGRERLDWLLVTPSSSR